MSSVGKSRAAMSTVGAGEQSGRLPVILLCPDFIPLDWSGYNVFDLSILPNDLSIAQLRENLSCCKGQQLYDKEGTRLDPDGTLSSCGIRPWAELQIKGQESLTELQVRCGGWWYQEVEVGKAWKRWQEYIYHCINHKAVTAALRHESWKLSELDEQTTPLETMLSEGGCNRRTACSALKRAKSNLSAARRLLDDGPGKCKHPLDVTVRPFALGDGQALLRLEREMVAEGRPVMSTVLDSQGEPKAMRLFVAVAVDQSGEVVGYTSWKRMPAHAWSTLKEHCGKARGCGCKCKDGSTEEKGKAEKAGEEGSVCELVNVYVSKAHRSRYVATTLLQTAVDHCKNVFAACQILAHAHVDNIHAHALLLKCGVPCSFRRFDYFREVQALPLGKAASYPRQQIMDGGRVLSPDGYLFAHPAL